MDFLVKPLGWILQQFSILFNGNFAMAVFSFTLLVNLIMVPLSIKSQKSSMGQLRIKPKMDELKKKYGDDKTRYSEEMQKLYQEENVSMSGGCLPMIIRLIIMLGVYNVVLSPLKYIVGISTELVNKAQEALVATGANLSKYAELDVLRSIKEGVVSAPEISEKLLNYDFNFLGIDLTTKPTFSLDIFHDAQLNWLIPVLAFAAAMISSVISLQIQKKNNPDAPSMKGMMFSMPFVSLVIGFTVSSAAGFYWACSSLISGVIQAVVQTAYGPQKMIAAEQTKELYKKFKDEKAIIEKAKKEDK